MDIFPTRPFEHCFRRRVYGLALLLLTTAALGLCMDRMLSRVGGWLPRIPLQIDAWTGKDIKMDWTFVDAPRYLSRLYANCFGEAVQVFLISPDSAYGYRDPRGCLRGSGYLMSAERRVSLGDHGAEARLMILRQGEMRLVMCYWMQERKGRARAEAPVFAYHAVTRAFASLGLVTNAMLAPHQVCMVRVYTLVMYNDPQGRQAQRNVMELAQSVYQAISHE